jgi:putative tricarboxylic transport membrane protein
MEGHPTITRGHVRIASAILTTTGAIYAYRAFHLSLGDPPGTGVGIIPIAIGVRWVAFGLYVTLRAPDIQVRDGEVGSWPCSEMTRRLLLAIGLCLGFIVVLPFLGMVVSSGFFLVLIGRLAGAPWGKSLLASIVLPVVFWLIFVKLLQVSLPEGSLFEFVFRG